jgi:hypothetical protein
MTVMGKGIVQKQQRLFVIFSGTQQHKKLGTHYITDAAGRQATRIRAKAAKFSTATDAQAFAERNHITLNAHTYIGQEDFTDFDLRGNPPKNSHERCVNR